MLTLENFYENTVCTEQMKLLANKIVVSEKTEDSFMGPQFRHAGISLKGGLHGDKIRVKLESSTARLMSQPSQDGSAKVNRSILLKTSDHKNVTNMFSWFNRIGGYTELSHPASYWNLNGTLYKEIQDGSQKGPAGGGAIFFPIAGDVQCFKADSTASGNKISRCKYGDILQGHGKLIYEVHFDKFNINVDKKRFYWKPTVVGIILKEEPRAELGLLNEFAL